MTDDFLICVNRTRRKWSFICTHSTMKLTRGVVHFIHRMYYAPKAEQKIKASWQIEVNASSKSPLYKWVQNKLIYTNSQSSLENKPNLMTT